MNKKTVSKEKRDLKVTILAGIGSLAFGYIFYTSLKSLMAYDSSGNPLIYVIMIITFMASCSFLYLAINGKKSTYYSIVEWFSNLAPF